MDYRNLKVHHMHELTGIKTPAYSKIINPPKLLWDKQHGCSVAISP
jgi:hypothetical protein